HGADALGEAVVEVGGELEQLALESLVQALSGRLDLEGPRAAQIVLAERQLLGVDAILVPRGKQLELESQALRGVLDRRSGPHAERLAGRSDAEVRAGPVGPAALAPHLAGQPRGKGASEGGVGHD